MFVDALGRITSEREFSQLPEPGDNIRLTIDADLQRAAEEALEYGIRLAHDQDEWAADGGALVALDVNTGEILALASNPTFDPTVYVGRVDEKELNALAAKSANHPTLNRAVAGLYPPGSTFKPFVALAALEEGLLGPDEYIQCTGEEVIDGQTFSNWDPYKNEPMTVSTALANSCDTFFYDVALRFYAAEGLAAAALVARDGLRRGHRASTSARRRRGSCRRRPGAGRRSRPRSTSSGRAATPSSSPSARATCSSAPLQMTRVYAMIANGGKLVEPHLVKSVEEPRNEGEPPVVLRPYTPKPAARPRPRPERAAGRPGGALRRDPRDLRDVAGGLRQLPGADRRQDRHGREVRPAPRLLEGLRDQSWWCGYGPYDAAGDRRLRADRERRPRRHRGGAGRAEGLREVLQRRAGQLRAVIQQSD